MRELTSEFDYYKLLCKIYDLVGVTDLDINPIYAPKLLDELASFLHKLIADDPHILFLEHVKYPPIFRYEEETNCLVWQCVGGKLDTLTTGQVCTFPYDSSSSVDLIHNHRQHRIGLRVVEIKLNIEHFIITRKIKVINHAPDYQ